MYQVQIKSVFTPDMPQLLSDTFAITSSSALICSSHISVNIKLSSTEFYFYVKMPECGQLQQGHRL